MDSFFFSLLPLFLFLVLAKRKSKRDGEARKPKKVEPLNSLKLEKEEKESEKQSQNHKLQWWFKLALLGAFGLCELLFRWVHQLPYPVTAGTSSISLFRLGIS